MSTNAFWCVPGIIDKAIIKIIRINKLSSSSELSTSASNWIKSIPYTVILPFCSNTDKFRCKNLLNCQLLPLIITLAVTLFSIFSFRLRNVFYKFSRVISRINYRCAYLLSRWFNIFYSKSSYYDVIFGDKPFFLHCLKNQSQHFLRHKSHIRPYVFMQKLYISWFFSFSHVAMKYVQRKHFPGLKISFLHFNFTFKLTYSVYMLRKKLLSQGTSYTN